ncbi:MAG: hypothetical protein AMXMBFR4_25290 [Candidatus Hydrogenedentota bacterium]
MELRGLLSRADGRDMCLGEIIESFPHRSHVLMIVLFSFPMSLPISPPFLGGVFGLILAFLGFYLVVGKKPWVPGFLHRRPISYRVLFQTIHRLTAVAKFLESFLKPRLLVLTRNSWLWRMHGLYIVAMALFLALPAPVPLPLTNTVVGIPIFLTALGLLERDGIVVILGYLAAIVCFTYYGLIVWFGAEAFQFFVNGGNA